jgi:hypothetical protein
VIDPLSLPFDQYQRYRFVSDLLSEVRPRGKSWTVLDVGGRTALLRAFLPSDQVHLIDLEPSSEAGLVLGDGSRLPYQDKSVDVIVAFDTLEHVPPHLRETFCSECARVARKYVVLAGPYQSAEVEEAEKLLQQFLKDKLGVEHRYLEEHRHLGLPDRAAVETCFQGAGAHVSSLGHGNLERWLGLMCMSLYMDYTPPLRGIAARFFRFYNQNLYASDHGAPVYRHAVVAALAGAPLPTPSGFAPAVAPPGAVARMHELAFELVDFERAKSEWDRVRGDLERAKLELTADLQGHRATCANLARDFALARSALIHERAEHASVVADLSADLDGHKATCANLRREADLARAAHARDRAEHERVERELLADLAAHRSAKAELEADLEGHRRTVANLMAAPDSSVHRRS